MAKTDFYLFDAGVSEEMLEGDYQQDNYSSPIQAQKQNNDPMKEIKRNYGDYLRQQIKHNEEKKKNERQGSNQVNREQNEHYQMNDISNQQYSMPQEKHAYQRIKYDPNQESSNQKPQPDKQYGDYLKRQMEDKKKQNVNTDFKQSKIQELQDKMAAQSENPYGKGGSGAPLMGKNGEIISSRKPDIAQVQYDFKGSRSQNTMEQQGNYITQSQPNYQLNRDYQPSSNMNESLANRINDTQLYKNRPTNELGGGASEKRDFYRANVNYNMESSLAVASNNIFQDNASIKPANSENATNFRRNNKRLIDRENQNEADVMRKEKQKQEINNALQEQIMLKDRKKQQEKQREKEEELRIEERVKKEREELEKQTKQEEDKKKKAMADLKQDNEDLKKNKKNKVIIPYHLDESSPQKPQLGSQNTNKAQTAGTQPQYAQQQQQQQQYQFDNNQGSSNKKSNSVSNPAATTNQLSDFYSMFNQQPFQNTVYSQNQLYAQNTQGMYNPNPYNISPSLDVYANTFQLQRMALNSAESRNRDIIPEIDNMKQQIQDQYKNLQFDVHRAKMENIQAIDERNKYNSMSRQQVNPYTIDYSDFNQYSSNPYNNQQAQNYNIQRQQYSKSRESTGYQNQRRQANSADQNNYNNMLQQKQIPNQMMDQDYNIQSLDTESKMIPMDLIDHLRQKDKLTMSQLINYDQDYSQNPVLNHNNNNNQGRIGGNGEEQDNPNSLKWDTINSDITKDIDKILSYQSHQIHNTAMLQQQEEEMMKNKYSSQSQHRTKIKSETTFNMAAKGILDTTGYSQQGNNRFPPNQNNYENSQKRNNTGGYSQGGVANYDNHNSLNSTNSFQQRGNHQIYDDHHREQNSHRQDLNMSDLQHKLERDNEIQRNQDTESQFPHNYDKNNYDSANREEYKGGEQDPQSRDQIFDYRRNSESAYQSDKDEDSDEIKKQKALREIKERFHLSTVNEELNEKTRHLSTILETGKYQENKDLYESLRNVEDPDFLKLDDLIRQFKSTHLQPSNNKNK